MTTTQKKKTNKRNNVIASDLKAINNIKNALSIEEEKKPDEPAKKKLCDHDYGVE